MINPLTYNIYSDKFYMQELIYNRSFSVMSRLFGFEFPSVQGNYFESLLNSRYYIDIFLKRLQFFKDRRIYLNFCVANSFIKFFLPAVQFSIIPFRSSNLTFSINSLKKQYKIGWYQAYEFYMVQDTNIFLIILMLKMKVLLGMKKMDVKYLLIKKV